MDHLDFSSTIDRSLVHRAAIAEVFVTSHVQVDVDTFDFGVQVPRRHALYGDNPAGRMDHDPLFFVEACRQSGIVLAHEYFGVPLDTHFVLRDLALEVSDPALLVADDQRPTNAVVRCRVRQRFRRRDRSVTGLRVRIAVLVGDRELLGFESSYSWMTGEEWAALRRANRTRLGLPATPVRCPSSSPAEPDNVGRRDPSNVVISLVEQDAALLVVDTGNPTMFDHPLDHVPGMLQLEAVRQLSLAIMRDRQALSPSDGALLAISAKFLGFVELDLPARVHGEVLDDGASLRCAVVQDGRTQVKVDLRLGYRAERRSRPVATAGRATHAP